MDNEIKRLTEHVQSTFDLKIRVGVPDNAGSITGVKPSKYELFLCLGLTAQELQKYPPSFFKKNGIGEVIYASSLKRDGTKYIGGLFDLKMGAYIDSSLIVLSCSDHQNSIFHHEIYHGSDYKHDGFKKEDAEWIELHNCECQPYSEDSDNNWFIRRSLLEPKPYGQTAAVEDRAVFAETMMMPESHKKLKKLIESEQDSKIKEILLQKYNRIKSDYFLWSKGLMNEQYWEDLIADRIAADYFNNKPENPNIENIGMFAYFIQEVNVTEEVMSQDYQFTECTVNDGLSTFVHKGKIFTLLDGDFILVDEDSDHPQYFFYYEHDDESFASLMQYCSSRFPESKISISLELTEPLAEDGKRYSLPTGKNYVRITQPGYPDRFFRYYSRPYGVADAQGKSEDLKQMLYPIQQ